MIRIKTSTPFWALLLAGGILLASCSQDAIFYTIQYDKVLNKNAAVPGSPGKIISLGSDPDNALYTGSNAIYRYKNPGSGAASWIRLPAQPGGKRIMDLAGTEAGPDSYLYALVMQGVNLSESGLYRKPNPNNDANAGPWESVDKAGGGAIQSLIGAGDTLFAGVYGGSLWYVTGRGGTLAQASGISGILKAAAFYAGRYYVALEGTGILSADSPADLGAGDPLSHGGNTPGNFVGLVEAGNSLIAVSGGGLIWRIDNSGAVVESKQFNVSCNGAVAKWKDPGSGNDTDLLLLGRAVAGGSSVTTYYYGYSELPVTVTAGGTTPVLGAVLQEPGLPMENAFTSVSNNNSYYNTLGTHAVISLYQAPWDNVLFAATQQDGLWSCRSRGDPKEWNVE
ncbi:MAG: hypothetical protein LBH57_09160 [Treponema sp.]|jgi:hypothetical protein|nr:hypothetical protein [Treponema sp.]